MSSASHNSGRQSSESGVRRVRMRSSGATLDRLPGGVMRVKPEEALKPYPKVLTDRIAHWAKLTPEKPASPSAAPAENGAVSATRK